MSARWSRGSRSGLLGGRGCRARLSCGRWDRAWVCSVVAGAACGLAGWSRACRARLVVVVGFAIGSAEWSLASRVNELGRRWCRARVCSMVAGVGRGPHRWSLAVLAGLLGGRWRYARVCSVVEGVARGPVCCSRAGLLGGRLRCHGRRGLRRIRELSKRKQNKVVLHERHNARRSDVRRTNLLRNCTHCLNFG